MTRSRTCDSSICRAALWCTMRPSFTTRTRSARLSTSGTSLETSRTPMSESARARTSAYNSARAPTSTPRVGSSSSSSRQPLRNQRASTAFCWLPPESVRTGRLGSSGRISSERACAAASLRSELFGDISHFEQRSRQVDTLRWDVSAGCRSACRVMWVADRAGGRSFGGLPTPWSRIQPDAAPPPDDGVYTCSLTSCRDTAENKVPAVDALPEARWGGSLEHPLIRMLP